MLKLKAPCLTSTPVMRASAHIGKFYDIQVRDAETGECYRADHLPADTLNYLVYDDTTAGQDRLKLTALRAHYA